MIHLNIALIVVAVVVQYPKITYMSIVNFEDLMNDDVATALNGPFKACEGKPCQFVE